jgi:hypothetical protein
MPRTRCSTSTVGNFGSAASTAAIRSRYASTTLGRPTPRSRALATSAGTSIVGSRTIRFTVRSGIPVSVAIRRSVLPPARSTCTRCLAMAPIISLRPPTPWVLHGRSGRQVIGAPQGAIFSGNPGARVSGTRTWCRRTGAALISDEVFGDFPWSASAVGSETLLRGDRTVPTVVLSGVSKVCGLPQLKLAWMAAAGPRRDRRRLVEALEWIADLFLSVSGPVQDALPSLLAGRHAFQAAVHERLRINLARLRRAAKAQPALTVLDACGGWMATLRVPRVRSEEEWALELLRRGVVVHPGHFYDMIAEAHLIISLIVEPDIFNRGVTVIEALVAEDR